MNNDTIAAISTPAGNGGIGIIKISGENARYIASLIFKKSGSKKNHILHESHKLYHGHIIDPDSKIAIDEVLLSLMISPHSYTGEDIVEINVHSGTFLLKTILNIVINKGARLAEPGEFTKRAFVNGRIDLTQAEAIVDIINAKNKRALEIANSQIDGLLRNCIETMLHELNNIIVKVEAGIDFPDDIEGLNFDTDIKNIEINVTNKLKELIAGYDEGHVLREGIKLVIAGRPNVGKSSLMNRLLNKDRAIVTSIPGTTRDIIEETIMISGLPAIISDTAGLHNTKDPIESIGIQKTKEYISNADIILFVINAINPFTDEDKKLFENIKKKRLVVVFNKIDLLQEGMLVEINEDLKSFPCVMVSSLHNKGLDLLKETVKESAIKNLDYNSSIIVPNLRQKTELEKCLESVILVCEGMKTGQAYEILSIDLKSAIESLNLVIGKNIKIDVLDQIFSRFCIGK